MSQKKKNPLPPKEAQLWKQLMKNYEAKQYKRGIKCADQILRKFPEHAESLSMRALMIHQSGKIDEGLRDAKRGVELEDDSFICWHVLALIYKYNQNFKEAAKTFVEVLKIAPKNIGMLRELAYAQLACRDFSGFNHSCSKLLKAKPNNANYWYLFVCSTHLLGHPKKALDVLDKYRISKKFNDDVERNGILLYKAKLIEEIGDTEAALKFLDDNKSQISDKLSWRERRVSLLLKLDKKDEAVEEYRILLHINPENHDYYKGLQVAKGIADGDNENLLKMFNELKEDTIVQIPKWCQSIKVLPLIYISGDSFKEGIDAYLKEKIAKGTPSLRSTLKPMYKSAEKTEILGALLEGYVDSLRTNKKFPNEESEAPPSALAWSLYYLSFHYVELYKIDEAKKAIDEAIAHSPTAIELYLCKGRVYKHAGDVSKTLECYEAARKLDLADRFINVKVVKYLLRCNQPEKANEIFTLFTKDGDTSEKINIYDMQVMWYLLEAGDNYLKHDQLPKALRQYLAMKKFFADFAEDKADLHMYCMRKFSLLPFIDMVKWEKQARGSINYFSAISNATKCFITLHDNFEKLSDKEKEEAVKQREACAAQLATDRIKKINDNYSTIDAYAIDPNGNELLANTAPLDEARKLVQDLNVFHKDRLTTQVLNFEIAVRKQQYLLAMLAVQKMQQIAKEAPETHLATVQLFHLCEKNPKVMGVDRVLQKSAAFLAGLSSPAAFNDAGLKAHEDDLLFRIAVARARVFMDSNADKKDILSLLNFVPTTKSYCNLKALEKANEAIKELVGADEASSHSADIAKLYPFATYFGATNTDDSNSSDTTKAEKEEQ